MNRDPSYGEADIPLVAPVCSKTSQQNDVTRAVLCVSRRVDFMSLFSKLVGKADFVSWGLEIN